MKPCLVLIFSCAAISALTCNEKLEDVMSVKLDNIQSKLLELQNALQAMHVAGANSRIQQSCAKNVETSLLCRDVSSQLSGIYQISINNGTESFPVFCEQTAYGGGWLVVQHRVDGSVSFDRNWDAYRQGFGSLGGEYWIGLDRLHQLTSSRRQVLLIEMKSFTGKYAYAHYQTFEIGSEKQEFFIKTVEGYNGTAGDGMKKHKGFMFSTLDHNNNINAASNYTKTSKGGWWYGTGWTNLNGPYVNNNSIDSMFWYDFNCYYSNGKFNNPGLSYSKMMIRPAV